jgi:hypothetical protein
MLKRFCYVTPAVILLLGGLYTGTLVRANQAAPAAVALQPATLHEVDMAIDNSGQNITTTTKVIGIRSDGTLATLTTPVHRILPSSRVIEQPDGFHALIIDDLKLISSWYMNGQQVEKLRVRRASPNCLERPNDAILGSEVLFARRVIISQRTWDDLRATMWNAPSLGCYTLRSTLEQKQNGAFALVAENRVDVLKEGEPTEQQLFTVPADAVEVSPSEIYVRQEKRDRATMEDKSVTYWARRDEMYQKERQNPPVK